MKLKPTSISLEANGKPIVVAVDEFRGRWYLSARFYYVDQDTGELKPGKNGINIQIDGEEGIEAVEVVMEAMQQALLRLLEG